MRRFLIFFAALNLHFGAYGQSLDSGGGGAVEITDGPAQEYPAKETSKGSKPRVGRKAAQKYMGQKGEAAPPTASASITPAAQGDHYLAVHLGAFVSDNAYKWGGRDGQSNVGNWNFGVTYRVGEWVNSMDLGIRIDLAGFNLEEGRASKLSFLPVITFPEAGSRFPLYFGAGVGPGVFLNQTPNESSLSLDYQLFGGVRFFEVFKSTGFFVEAGLKNHFLLLSDGQFNGTFAALGAVFTF